MRGSASGIAFALAAAIALLAPAAWADSTVTSLDLEETATWRSPSGAPETFEWTLDGRLLLVMGAGDDRTIHVLDRSLAPLGTASAPFDVRGASWSMKARWLLAWGPDGERDNITAWDVPSLAPNATVVPRGLLTVATIDAARFYAKDEILVICGRDGERASRINVIEIRTKSVLRDLEDPSNRTVLFLANDDREVVCIYEGGVAVPFSTQNWSAWGAPRTMTGEVTAHCIVPEWPWLLGDSNGTVRAFRDLDGSVYASFRPGGGPVLGIAYGSPWMSYVLVALPGDVGGGRIKAYTRYIIDAEPTDTPILVTEVNTSSTITSMAQIPMARNNVTVGYADGRLVNYWANATLAQWDDPQGPDDGPRRGEWLRTYGGLATLVAVAVALAVAYAWLRRREG